MSRKIFLTVVACVALAVGTFALLGTSALLEGKGAVSNDAAQVMTREVGVLLLAVGLLAFMIRSHPDSKTLRAVLIANAALQIMILPIEIIAHAQGTFAKLAGIVPNSVFHVLAAAGFIFFASRAGGPAPISQNS